MKVLVNGEATEVESGVTVAALIDLLGHSPRGLAVAVDGAVVPRSTWSAQPLTAGARVEVLAASQGG